jgi:NADP-dependent 3-hydroxy acid dehydrogenase YdfG
VSRLRPDAVFFVTGAARGIGAAFTRLAVARGGSVAASDVDEAPLTALCHELGERAFPIGLDVRDHAAWARALAEAEARFGRIDVLVNNAGLIHSGTVLEQSLSQIQQMLDVNLLGVLHGLRAGVPRLAAHGGGHVVDVGSYASYFPLKGQAFYSATKHAVRALHHAFAMEQAGGRVTFTLVCPTAVDTPMLHQQVGIDSNAMAFAGRPVTAERVAEAIWRAAERRPAEILVPTAGGVAARLVGVFPRVLRAVTRQVERGGLRAMRRRPRQDPTASSR